MAPGIVERSDGADGAFGGDTRLLRHYLALDRRFAVAIYEAADARTVRLAHEQAGLFCDAVWEGELVVGGPAPVAPPGRVTVIAQRELPRSFTAEEVQGTYARGEHCLGTHRVEPLGSYLSGDGRRLLCVFAALDAESVRASNRALGVPLLRVFTAEVTPPGTSR